MTKFYFIAGECSGDYIGSTIINNLKRIWSQEDDNEIETLKTLRKLYEDGRAQKTEFVKISDWLEACSMVAKTSCLLSKKDIAAVKSTHNQLKFVGVGGDLMEQSGVSSLFPIEKINIMGFFNVIPHLFKIYHLINYTVEDIKQQKPNVVITIDSPGFTFRVAKKIRSYCQKHNIKLIHIVAPSVWAYKPGRAKKYAKVYDLLLSLLPFEAPLFTKHGLDTYYIGYPVLQQHFLLTTKTQQNLQNELINDQEEKIICVTPGSRKNEIDRHLKILSEALNFVALKHTKLKVLFVANSPESKNFLEEYITSIPQKPKYNYKCTDDRLTAYGSADLALAKSGTNTLEIAASGTPMIILYKLDWLNFWFIKMLIKVKYVNLINIMANKEIIPELIQNNCTPQKIADLVVSFFANSDKGITQVQETQKHLQNLGFQSKITPSYLAARIISNTIRTSFNDVI